MSKELKTQLTEIRGVGDATATEIINVIDSNHDNGNTEKLTQLIELAHDYHKAGDHEYAEKFVRRAHKIIE